MIDAINSESIVWSEQERQIGKAVLEKLRLSALAKKIPHDVYEAHLKTFKKISTEGVFINHLGQIYLAQRPSQEKDPAEPYPNQWHSPGVTHMLDETNADAFKRLMIREIGQDVEIVSQYTVATPEVPDSQRGLYRLEIYLFYIKGTPKSDMKGRFFDQKDMMTLDLVSSHRKFILPAALKKMQEIKEAQLQDELYRSTLSREPL